MLIGHVFAPVIKHSAIQWTVERESQNVEFQLNFAIPPESVTNVVRLTSLCVNTGKKLHIGAWLATKSLSVVPCSLTLTALSPLRV